MAVFGIRDLVGEGASSARKAEEFLPEVFPKTDRLARVTNIVVERAVTQRFLEALSACPESAYRISRKRIFRTRLSPLPALTARSSSGSSSDSSDIHALVFTATKRVLSALT